MAPVYDALGFALFFGALARSRRVWLDRVCHGHRALLVGDGTGGFMADLLSAGYGGEIVYLDISEGMLAAARRRMHREYPAAGGRIQYVCGPAEAFEDSGGSEGFDMIATHFFLDGFGPQRLDRIVAALTRCLQPGGVWTVTDFAPAVVGGIRRISQASMLQCLYGFFRLTCGIDARELPDIDAALGRQGLLPIARSSSLRGRLESSVWILPKLG